MKTYSVKQLERYPIYLKYFKELEEAGEEIVSSPRIAAKLGYSEEQVRKDLQNISLEPGRPKKGRAVKQLIEDLETFLGYRSATNAVLIGVGHLGGALLNFPLFTEMGLSIQAGFDTNEELIGKQIGGKPIYSVLDLPRKFKELDAKIAIITVPVAHAQKAADLAIACGAKAIWNFAPANLEVTEPVAVENVNFASSLAILTHKLNLVLASEARKGE